MGEMGRKICMTLGIIAFLMSSKCVTITYFMQPGRFRKFEFWENF